MPLKASRVAQVVSALLATDAKPTEATILSALIAADKKAKDEGGLGPVEIENKEKAEDAAKFGASDAEANYFGKAKDEWEKMSAKDRKSARDKAKDEKDDPENTNDGDPDVGGMDDIQPAKSASGNAGAGGKEPAQDKKAMDEKRVASLIAANDAKHVAAREVESILGVVAFDSADKYYGAALAKLGVDAADIKDVPASTLRTMLRLAKDKAAAQTPTMATDAAQVTAMAAAIPGYGRLR